MTTCHTDFETRSELNVSDVGAWKYANHPSTQVISTAFAFDDEPVEHLDEFQHPLKNKTPNASRDRLYEAAANPKIIFAAHNAGFERAIWKRRMVPLGYPKIPRHRWKDTAAKASRHGLPRALDGVCEALETPHQKDLTGNRTMKSLAKPRRTSKENPDRFWYPDKVPEKFKVLYSYNIDDVEAERDVDKAIPDLEPFEQEIWVLDQEMNERGIRIDREAVVKSIELLKQHKKKLLGDFVAATGWEVNSPAQNAKWKAWLNENGVEVSNVQGETLSKIIVMDEGEDLIPDYVKDAIKIALELSQTSTAKFSKLLEQMTDDDRIRDYLIYHGAERTGRWTGKLVQLQNLKRPPKGFDMDQVVADIKKYGYDVFSLFYPKVIDTISCSIRGMIISSEGHELYVSDFSSIESRVRAWFCDDKSALTLFWQLDCLLTDIDNYCAMASDILGRPITKRDEDERQMGKVGDLSLGFAGGINAFAKMAPSYNLDLNKLYPLLWPTTSFKERKRARKAWRAYKKTAEKPIKKRAGLAVDIIKQRFRKTHSEVSKMWKTIEGAAIAAIKEGGKQEVRNGVYFRMTKDKRFLRMYLPSGRYISYFKPRLASTKTPWGEDSYKIKYRGRKDGRDMWLITYGGKLFENAIQAIARDLMAFSFVNIRKAGFFPLLLVHDEGVAEAPIGYSTVERYNHVMRRKPQWAETLPMETAGWIGQRYKKG